MIVRKHTRNLPDQIVDLFLALVFIGDLKAGDRIPAELKLTEILKVNRSSLRMAMRVLARMNVIESTRGSGLIVLDYKEHTGLDFLSEIVKISELEIGSEFLMQVLEGARPVLLPLAKSFVENGSIERCIHYLNVLDLQIKCLKEGGDPKSLASLDIILQNGGSYGIGNSLLRASFNSLLPIRYYLLEMYYAMDGDRTEYITAQKENLLAYIGKEITGDQFVTTYLELAQREAQALLDHLQTLPTKSKLKISPLLHYPEMMSLRQS